MALEAAGGPDAGSGGSPEAPRAASSLDDGLRDGRALIRRYRRRADAELAAATQAVAADPADVESAVRAARVWLELGAPLEAARILSECLEAGGSPRKLYRDGAQLLFDAGLFRKAAQWLIRSIAAAAGEPGEPSFTPLDRAMAALVRDALAGLSPDDRRRYLAALEALGSGRPEQAEPLLAELAQGHPDFAAAWLAWRGARQGMGRTSEAEAIGAQWAQVSHLDAETRRAVTSRRLSARGLPFDPAQPIVHRQLGSSFAEVGEAAALGDRGDKILVLERGGEALEIEPVIPLAAVGPQQTRFAYKAAAKFVAALDGGAVVGHGVVLNLAGEIPEETWPPCSLEKARFKRVREGFVTDPRLFRGGACPVQVHDTPALMMATPTDSSFGDWMLNVPDRLALAAQAGLDCPLVLREGTPARFVEILADLGWDTRRIIYHDPRGVSLFPRLYATSWPLQHPDRPMRGLLGVYRRAVGRRRLPAGRGERLFLSREGVDKRRLLNEPDIRSIFERRGFRAISPERMGLQEAKDLFANADIIAGPYGSAFLNVVHAPEPPTALVLMPPDAHRFLSEVALWLGSSGARFGYVFGDPAPDRGKRDPWSAPAAKVEAALDELLAQAGRS